MGVHIKALIVTTLIMQIASIFALTSVWAVSTELHAPTVLVNGALLIVAASMLVLAVMVYRRALQSERRMAADTGAERVEELASEIYPASTLPNQIGKAMVKRPVNPASAAAARFINIPH